MRTTGDPVPNQFPLVEPPGPARIAVVGASPGKEEDYFGKPFIGASGQILDGALETVGLTRSQCFVGNVCQYRPGPDSDDFSLLDWDGEKVQAGIAQLRADLERFRPSIVLCLGNEALHLFKHGNVKPRRGKGGYDWPSKITSWRGSLFTSSFLEVAAPFRCPSCGHYERAETFCEKCGEITKAVTGGALKCLPTFHPAFVSRDRSLQGYYRACRGVGDFERLKIEAETRELVLPKRDIGIVGVHHSLDEGLSILERMASETLPVGFDIEGGPGNVTSLAFSRRPENALVFPLAHIDGTSVWSEEDEIIIWQAAKAVLESPITPKVVQHGVYDLFATAWTYGIVPAGDIFDTEELFWELFAELKKSLACQASFLTKEPFYKPDREEGELKFDSDQQFWNYNGLDAAVTIEVWQKMMSMLTEGQARHFAINRRVFGPKLYMMLRGLRVDKKRMKAAATKAEQESWRLQAKIDQQMPIGTPVHDFYTAMQLAMNEEWFAKLCLRSLGGKNPRVKVQVVEERWQPKRWNGKKWVKAGKLVTELPENFKGCNAIIEAGFMYVEAHRTVEKLVPFVPSSLADVEPFVTQSTSKEEAKRKAEVWEKVKRVWKELKNDKQAILRSVEDDNAASSESAIGANAGNTVDRSKALLGCLSTLLSLAINTGSNSEDGDTQQFLYETCGLPRIYKGTKTGRYSREPESAWKKRAEKERLSHAKRRRNDDVSVASEDSISRAESSDLESPLVEAGKSSEEKAAGKRLSTDQQALDLLYAHTRDERALWVLQQRRLRKVITDLSLPVDDDGRIRFSLSLVKDTGRMSASESPLGTGTNPQAWNKDLRHVVVSDEGCELGQLDLEGADSWTVAAECAALGDRTMLDDLLAGLKPAKIMCLIDLLGSKVNQWDRQEIKAKLAETALEPWHYPAHKSGHHGYDYGMGHETLITTVLKYSMADLPIELGETKPVVLTSAQAKAMLAANGSRYPGVKRWHEKEAQEQITTGKLVTSVGHVRAFYGRKAARKQGRLIADHDTLKQRLASKPQFYTTLNIKLALIRQWEDPENRRDDGSLIVEPLLVVHDSKNDQWRIEDREFACRKLREWMRNELEIAGQKIVIPADGTRGGDWGMKDAEKL